MYNKVYQIITFHSSEGKVNFTWRSKNYNPFCWRINSIEAMSKQSTLQ